LSEARTVVQDFGDRLGGDSRPVVGDRDVSTFHLDIDDGRAADLLGLVERVVGQLLQDNQGPLLGRVSGLRRQFLERAKLNKPACREHVAFEAVRFGRSGVVRQTSDGLTAGAVVFMVVFHLSSFRLPRRRCGATGEVSFSGVTRFTPRPRRGSGHPVGWRRPRSCCRRLPARFLVRLAPGVDAVAVEPNLVAGVPAFEQCAALAAVGADPLGSRMAVIAPVPPKSRNTRNRRNIAHSIGISSLGWGATSLAMRCNIRVLRLGIACCGVKVRGRNTIPLKCLPCCGVAAVAGFPDNEGR
jgi:hypothetical protein